MKKFPIFLFTVAAVLICSKCENVSDLDIENSETKREFTSIEKDENLNSIKLELLEDNPSAKKNSLVSRVNWSKAYKIKNTKLKRTSYTVPLIVNQAYHFENLILSEKDGEKENHIIRYVPDKTWLKNKPLKGGFSSFTGMIELLEIDGQIRSSTNFVL